MFYYTMLIRPHVSELSLRSLCITMIVVLLSGICGTTMAQAPLAIARTEVNGDQVDVWLRLPPQTDAFDPAQVVLTEDGQPQSTAQQPSVEQYTTGVAIVMRDDGAVDHAWLVAALRVVLGLLPADSLVTLSSCQHGADVLVAPTFDHNAPFNQYVGTSETSVAPVTCQPSSIAGGAVRTLMEHPGLQSFAQVDLIAIGGAVGDDANGTVRRWSIVPDASVPAGSTTNTIGIADPTAASTPLQDLASALDASRHLVHATYTSHAAPGPHTVGANYRGSSFAEGAITIPVLSPRITLLKPELDQLVRTGEIGLGIAVEYQQTPLQSVRYLVNGNEVARATQSPFAATWRATLPPGSYTLVAVATDRSQAEASSPQASITLARPAVRSLFAPWFVWSLVGGAACVLLVLLISRVVRKRMARGATPLQDAQLFSLLDVSTGIPTLHVVATTSDGRTIEAAFNKTSVRVGRDAHLADFTLADSDIAPIHLTIWHREYGIVIEPQGIVFVDDQPMTTTFDVVPGMQVQLGRAMLSVEKRASVAQPTPRNAPSNGYTTNVMSSMSENMTEHGA